MALNGVGWFFYAQTLYNDTMSHYLRAAICGGTYFFTVVTYRRRPILCDAPVRAALRSAIKTVQSRHPFAIDAWEQRGQVLQSWEQRGQVLQSRIFQKTLAKLMGSEERGQTWS